MVNVLVLSSAILACFVLSAHADLNCSATAANFTLLGTFSVPSPAFLTFGPNPLGQSSLFISQFFVDPFKKGSVSAVSDIIGNWPHVSKFQATELFDYVWPNRMSLVPTAVFGRDHLFAIAGGFLVPGKSTGAVSIVDLANFNSPVLYKVSTDLSGHFYHETFWYDMDGDGKVDLVSARASKPVIGPSTGQLLWFRNPGTLTQDQPWEQTILLNGPDVFFRIADLNSDGKPEIIAAQFFSSKLVVYECNSATPGACQSSSAWDVIFSDNTIGALFDVVVADLNADGHPDLLVTNHVDNVALSGVFAYEVPATLRPGQQWTRHTIAEGFKVLVPGPNQASPGSAKTFFPNTAASRGRPWIALSGDGAAQAYVLRPRSSNPNDWTYICEVLESAPNRGTVGELTVADVNGDGNADIFVTEYDHSSISVYSYV